MKDAVNHPSHYIPEDPAYECINVIEAWGLDKDTYLGNALKYISRAGKKDPQKFIQDLEKAVWYLNRRIANLKKDEAKNQEITQEKALEELDDFLQKIFSKSGVNISVR